MKKVIFVLFLMSMTINSMDNPNQEKVIIASALSPDDTLQLNLEEIERFMPRVTNFSKGFLILGYKDRFLDSHLFTILKKLLETTMHLFKEEEARQELEIFLHHKKEVFVEKNKIIEPLQAAVAQIGLTQMQALILFDVAARGGMTYLEDAIASYVTQIMPLEQFANIMRESPISWYGQISYLYHMPLTLTAININYALDILNTTVAEGGKALKTSIDSYRIEAISRRLINFCVSHANEILKTNPNFGTTINKLRIPQLKKLPELLRKVITNSKQEVHVIENFSQATLPMPSPQVSKRRPVNILQQVEQQMEQEIEQSKKARLNTPE